MQIPDAEGAAEPFMSRRRCRHEEDSPDQISSAAGSDCASGKRRCSRCGKSEMTQGLFAGLPCNSSKDAADLSFSTFGSEAFHAIDSMECISQLGWLQHCALTRRRILNHPSRLKSNKTSNSSSSRQSEHSRHKNRDRHEASNELWLEPLDHHSQELTKARRASSSDLHWNYKI
ncbi:hypothetical protein MPTK1_3g25010 [Marchantia polymorpha subsp. ruderalis]|uniref:Uncharacterized protein n=2 Tax=Marchantia polymorpha TaxID=3197 RepID=A0AAF6B4I8_MARPO|nr:hypothetical protein MARPO_0100s0014 [Marchantia polymorpha]BBN06922.1 hypothetical protein Mp_3g25010 [Marchantia polymorpha subsp. ruderalis]|eukprot:PTQ32299.1 hypothetical protein MARPO_0100s0014 [Marchantia polymorpha]